MNLYILFSCLSFSILMKAQPLWHRSSIGLHYWQRWESAEFDNHNFGLNYNYFIHPKIELDIELGMKYVPYQSVFLNTRYANYCTVGFNGYLSKNKNFSIDSRFLYDFKKVFVENKNKFLNIAIGYTYPISNDLLVKFNVGMMLNHRLDQFYGGVHLKRKF